MIRKITAKWKLKARGSKFRNVTVRSDGRMFDSKREAKRYSDLKLLEKAGEISSLEHHPRFDLCLNGRVIATYEADFMYFAWIAADPFARRIVEDVKPRFKCDADRRTYERTPAHGLWLIKSRLFEALHGTAVTVV